MLTKPETWENWKPLFCLCWHHLVTCWHTGQTAGRDSSVKVSPVWVILQVKHTFPKQ